MGPLGQHYRRDWVMDVCGGPGQCSPVFALGEGLSLIRYMQNCVGQGLVKLLCKGPDGKHLRLHGPVTDSVTCSSLFFIIS